MKQTLKKTDKLRNKSEFDRVMDGGSKSVSKYFVIVKKARQSTTVTVEASNSPRMGLIVSKKAGNAVARNRIKRITREMFRKVKQDLPGCDDFVFIARWGSGEAENCEIRKSLEKGFGRINGSCNT